MKSQHDGQLALQVVTAMRPGSRLTSSSQVRLRSAGWRPEHLISALSRSEMAALIALCVLPNMDLVFRTEDILSYMERNFRLDSPDLPTVSQGKPGRRMRWRQQVSDALTILLQENVLEMVATRKYRQVVENV